MSMNNYDYDFQVVFNSLKNLESFIIFNLLQDLLGHYIHSRMTWDFPLIMVRRRIRYEPLCQDVCLGRI